MILGDWNTGKTTLRNNLIGEDASNKLNYVFGWGMDFGVVDVQDLQLQIWDIQINKDIKGYQHVRPASLIGTALLIVTVDLTDQNSFINVPHWINAFISTEGNQSRPVLVVGSKIDLLPKLTKFEMESRKSKITSLLSKINLKSMSYLEISSKSKEDVELVMDKILGSLEP